MNKTVEKTETKSDETEAHTQEPILFETKLHNLFSELSVGVYVEVDDCLFNVNYDNTRYNLLLSVKYYHLYTD